MTLNQTLNQTLNALGLSTTPAGFGQKNVTKAGETLFTGTAQDVWAWLRTR